MGQGGGRRSLGFILGTFFARSKHLNILVEIWFALPTLLHLAQQFWQVQAPFGHVGTIFGWAKLRQA